VCGEPQPVHAILQSCHRQDMLGGPSCSYDVCAKCTSSMQGAKKTDPAPINYVLAGNIGGKSVYVKQPTNGQLHGLVGTSLETIGGHPYLKVGVKQAPAQGVTLVPQDKVPPGSIKVSLRGFIENIEVLE